MEVVDRHDLESRDWPFDRRFRALTNAFRVRSDVAGIGPFVEHLLSAFPDAASDGPVSTYTLTHRLSTGTKEERRVNRYELFQDGSSLQRVPNPGSMVEWVILDSTRRAVEGNERFVAVHAGVVSCDGRAVVMPAAPDSGKTTLSAGLTRAGFRFLGDEVALVDPATGWVHPFLRPLLIEPPSMAVLSGLLSELPSEHERFRNLRYQVSAEDLRAGATGGPCSVGYVVIPEYHPASVTRLRPISRATALMRLGEQTFNRARMGGAGIVALAQVVSGAECFELPIADLHEAIRAIEGLFARSLSGATIQATSARGETSP